uniref:Protein kinase domain-containing protein n=1 Tax=Mesocestoides corti TaxID=53468 RepID=A0A5K3EZ46_MESCO
ALYLYLCLAYEVPILSLIGRTWKCVDFPISDSPSLPFDNTFLLYQPHNLSSPIVSFSLIINEGIMNEEEIDLFGVTQNSVVFPQAGLSTSDIFKNTTCSSDLPSNHRSQIPSSPVSSTIRSKLTHQKRKPLVELSSAQLTDFSTYERHQLVTTTDSDASVIHQDTTETDENGQVGWHREAVEKAEPVVFSTPGQHFAKRPSIDMHKITPIPHTMSPSAEHIAQTTELRSPLPTSHVVGDEVPRMSHASRAEREKKQDQPEIGKKSDAWLKRLTRVFQIAENSLDESYIRAYGRGDAHSVLLKLSHQDRPMPFSHVFTKNRVKSVIKIGEGTFSEVFACRQENVAIKLFPIEGSVLFNGEVQKNAMEVISDVIASREVTRLTRGTLDKTENFAQLKRVSLLHGKLPAYLIKAWEHFRRLKGSENDHPKIFPRSQKWMALECVLCGGPLEFQMPSCPVARLSIFTQTALALAVAERRLRFEHRDLHWGNLLIDYGDGPSDCCVEIVPPTTTVNGVTYHPCRGPRVSVVDFTLSRLDHGEIAVCETTSKTTRIDIDLLRSQQTAFPRPFQGSGVVQWRW